MLLVFSSIRCLRKQSSLLFSISIDDLIIPATLHISQETEAKLRNSNLLAVFQTVMSGTDRISSVSTDHYPWHSLHDSNVRNSNKNPFQRTFLWASFSKLLGSSRTEEPVCTYFQLNSYNHLNTTPLLSRNGFCLRALGKPQSQKDSHFLPPELLLHSSALACSLLGPTLSCLIFRSSHIP